MWPLTGKILEPPLAGVVLVLDQIWAPKCMVDLGGTAAQEAFRSCPIIGKQGFLKRQ